MARASFRQDDIRRALKPALDAGLPIAGYEIDPATGRIIVHTAQGGGDGPDVALASWERTDARRKA